jgi:hypothetical protein
LDADREGPIVDDALGVDRLVMRARGHKRNDSGRLSFGLHPKGMQFSRFGAFDSYRFGGRR